MFMDVYDVDGDVSDNRHLADSGEVPEVTVTTPLSPPGPT